MPSSSLMRLIFHTTAARRRGRECREPYIAELHRWQRLLNRVTELDADPFSDPVELQDVIEAARRMKVQPDRNWS